MKAFVDSFGALTGILVGMGTIVYQMGRGLRKVSKFVATAQSMESRLAAIDVKITQHLDGHA